MKQTKNYPTLMFILMSGGLLAAGLAELIAYPGVLVAKTSVELVVLFLLWLLIGGYVWWKQKMPVVLTRVPKQIAGTLFFGLTLVIAWLINKEYGSYNNYLYSLYGFSATQLVYVWLTVGAVSFFSLPKKWVLTHWRWFIWILPLLLIALNAMMMVRPDGLVRELSKEDRLYEYLQTSSLLLASLLAFYSAYFVWKTKKNWLFALIYAGFAGGLFFLAGEEISWGQRILGYATPTYLEVRNVQKEMTIHNTRIVGSVIAQSYVLIGFAGAWSWFIWRLIKTGVSKHVKPWINLLIPRWVTMWFFWPIGLYNFHQLFIAERFAIWSEYTELLMTLGFFVFASENFYLLVKKRS